MIYEEKNELIDVNEPMTSSDIMSDLEDLAVSALLIELIEKKQAEIFENVVFEGKRRFYLEDLTERDFTLENTTPYQIELFGTIITDNAWGSMLCKVTDFLLSHFGWSNEKMLAFVSPWTNRTMFSIEKRTNFKPVRQGLYINCNHTALHSCWFLQDILDFFVIDKSSVKFLIHRPCSAEPKHVKEYIEKRAKSQFMEFLFVKHGKSEDQANKYVHWIDKYLNSMLCKISKSYTNFFLFDDKATLYNYVHKVREQIKYHPKFDQKAQKALNKCLDYLVEFY